MITSSTSPAREARRTSSSGSTPLVGRQSGQHDQAQHHRLQEQEHDVAPVAGHHAGVAAGEEPHLGEPAPGARKSARAGSFSRLRRPARRAATYCLCSGCSRKRPAQSCSVGRERLEHLLEVLEPEVRRRGAGRAEVRRAAAGRHEQHAVAQPQALHAVRDDDHGAPVVREVAEELHQASLVARVEPGGGLVEEEERRPGDELEAHAHAPPLAARERAHPRVDDAPRPSSPITSSTRSSRSSLPTSWQKAVGRSTQRLADRSGSCTTSSWTRSRSPRTVADRVQVGAVESSATPVAGGAPVRARSNADSPGAEGPTTPSSVRSLEAERDIVAARGPAARRRRGWSARKSSEPGVHVLLEPVSPRAGTNAGRPSRRPSSSSTALHAVPVDERAVAAVEIDQLEPHCHPSAAAPRGGATRAHPSHARGWSRPGRSRRLQIHPCGATRGPLALDSVPRSDTAPNSPAHRGLARALLRAPVHHTDAVVRQAGPPGAGRG